ncbi:hypothetical protein ANRL1_04617 [Anaerolineae bacterium]|nr:hypothetical protein ANRL1_04617 [Anaerolineae bacterium]
MRHLILLTMITAIVFCGGLSAQDRLTTTGGDVLNGKFVKLEAGKIFFEAEKVGKLEIAVGNVKDLSLGAARDVHWRVGDDAQKQEKGTLSTREGKVYLKDATGEREIDLAKFKGIDETVPDLSPYWDIAARFAFGWTEGNTQTYSMNFRFDIKRTSQVNVMSLFGEGNYFQDRRLEEDSVRRRDYALGYSYSYVFKFNLTIDLTEDLTWNELAGYHWRSVTGLGVGYYIIKDENTQLHVAGHGTYTHEDLMNGAEDKHYFGARLRAQFETFQLDRTLHIKAKSELLFDFSEIKNLVVNNELLVEYKFGGYFNAGLLVRHTWDNIPPQGFFPHDFSFLFTIGFSWGGHWH